MAMTEKSKIVFNYIKEHNGEHMVAADVAEALGLSTRVVDGVFTRSIQMRGLGARIPTYIETDDGVKEVKFLTLTEEGMAYDPDAEDAELAE